MDATKILFNLFFIAIGVWDVFMVYHFNECNVIGLLMVMSGTCLAFRGILFFVKTIKRYGRII